MARKAAAAWASSDTWATPRNFVAAAGYAAPSPATILSADRPVIFLHLNECNPNVKAFKPGDSNIMIL